MLFGLKFSLALASLLATVFSIWNLAENPSGIFRDSNGVNWSFLFDTAWSWFVPALLTALVPATILHVVATKLRSRLKNEKPVE